MKVKGGVTIFMLVSNQKKISSLTSAKSCNAGREGQEGTSLCVCNVLSLLVSCEVNISLWPRERNLERAEILFNVASCL